MAASQNNQITFCYRTADSATGVTRETAKRLAERLGVTETQAIHYALYELAVQILPQYGPDDGPLTAKQMKLIRRSAPKKKQRSVRSSLFDMETVERR